MRSMGKTDIIICEKCISKSDERLLHLTIGRPLECWWLSIQITMYCAAELNFWPINRYQLSSFQTLLSSPDVLLNQRSSPSQNVLQEKARTRIIKHKLQSLCLYLLLQFWPFLSFYETTSVENLYFHLMFQCSCVNFLILGWSFYIPFLRILPSKVI